MCPPAKIDGAAGEPVAGAGFAELPGFAMNAANYKQVEKDFAEWLYRNERADVFTCPPLKAWSKLGESEGDLRARLAHEARETRDAVIEKLRDATGKKIDTLQNRRLTAEGQLARQKAEATAANLQAGVSVLGGVLGALFGRKAGLGSITRGSAAITKARPTPCRRISPPKSPRSPNPTNPPLWQLKPRLSNPRSPT